MVNCGIMRIFFALILLFLPCLAAAEKVALVIGNSQYRNVAALPNPTRDADAVSRALMSQGFDVVLTRDLMRSDMLDTLRDFRDRADAADIAMIYYAGHGIEIGGRNYLIPVDARVTDARDARLEMVELDDMLAQLSGAKKMKMVVLDACRDNPFIVKLDTENPGRNIARGLASVTTADADTLIAYAAAAGAVTPDGEEGSNSPFTTAFLTALDEPPADVRIILGKVRDEMRRSVPGSAPFVYSSLGGGEYVINPNSTRIIPAEPAKAVDDSAIIRDFATAELTDTREAWETFVAKYEALPDHPLRILASRRLALSEKAGTKVAALEVPESPRALNDDVVRAEPQAEPDAEPLLPRDEAMRGIQRELQARNCYLGRIDGIYGGQTRRGLAELSRQSGRSLTIDGRSSAEEMNRLLETLGQLSGAACPQVARVAPTPTAPRKPVQPAAPKRAPAPATAEPTIAEQPTGTVFKNPPNYCPQYGTTATCRDGSPRKN